MLAGGTAGNELLTIGTGAALFARASAITRGGVRAGLLIPQFGPWLHANLHHGARFRADR